MSEQQAKQETKKAAAADSTEDERQARVRGQRSLIIHVLLMFLVSIVVFVIGSYFFIVPRVVRHRLDAQHTAGQLVRLQKEVVSLRQALAQRVAPQPADVKDEGTADEKAPAEPPAAADASK